MAGIGFATIQNRRPFVSSWKTNNAGTSSSVQITVPTSSTGVYNCSVDWGDGNISTPISTYNDAQWTHTYSGAGTYTVKIFGIFNGFVFNNGGDKLKLLNISQWGNQFRIGVSQQLNFYGCSNLTITANDILNMQGTLTPGGCFRNCTSITTIPSLNNWNFAGVTSFMDQFLFGCTSFNQVINLNVSGAQSFGNFMQGCTSFNSLITLNLSNAAGHNMALAFAGMTSFNQSVAGIFGSLSNGPTNLHDMFNGCTSFNQSVTITATDITTMNNMFLGCTSLNSPISIPTSNCTSFNAMFSGCTVFNQDVSAFSIAALTDATNMFASSGFNITNYNKLLDSATGWPSQATIQSSVVFSAGTAHYSGTNAITGRATLATTKTWTITDGGTP